MNVGQLVCGGFQGTTVNAQATRLIVDYQVLTLIILRKNTVNVRQVTKLIKDLQWLAYTKGKYASPLMFCMDEEGGMMNVLFDQEFLTQMPLAMGLAATGDPELVYELSKAVAIELKRIGFLIILGPVLDVITKLSHQLVGVRLFAPTIDDVIKYGSQCAKGFKDGGLITVGKHFPGIGNAAVDLLMELPMMADLLDQIRLFNVQPFALLIRDGLLDGILAAGCGVPTILPDETHACLLPVLLTQLLRNELKFDGFVILECLEMDALYHLIGLSQGVILAILAGCDLVLVCQDAGFQKEVIEAIRKGIENGILEDEVIANSQRRIAKLQLQCPPFLQLFPGGEYGDDTWVPYKQAHPEAWTRHQALSQRAYEKLITLVRDYNDLLPLTRWLVPSSDAPGEPEEPANLLLLLPLLNPLYPSIHVENEHAHLYRGEEVFQHFGDVLAHHPLNLGDNRLYNVLHTTYTANGLTQLHELLIAKLKVVVILTLEASRNMYQIGIVKYVLILCGALPSQVNNPLLLPQLAKPLVIIATLLPYDFFYSRSLGLAYMCCYDYTNAALEKVAAVLMGDAVADGCIPGEQKYVRANQPPGRRAGAPQRRWLVDEFDINRDWHGLLKLWKTNALDNLDLLQFDYKLEGFYKRLFALLMTKDGQKHFVVRNSSLNILYGIVITWVDGDAGKIVYILVDKLKRIQSIGKNLYTRAVRFLVQERNCATVDMGLSFPMLQTNTALSLLARTFLHLLLWLPPLLAPKRYIMALANLGKWQVPQKIFRELMIVGVRFDICLDSAQLMDLVKRLAEQGTNMPGLYREAVAHIGLLNSVKIIIALEPTNQRVIGLVILFTNRLQLLKFFPWIDDCALDMDSNSISKIPSVTLLQRMALGGQTTPLNSLVGGIVGPLIDPLYLNLTEIFKYGLICSGITLLKSLMSLDGEMNKCVMIGAQEGKMKQGVEEIGFEVWKLYYDNYGRRPAGEL